MEIQSERNVAVNANLKKIIMATILITPSGALSPGPLSASAIAVGASLGLMGGILVSLGHMIVELPYVGLLFVFLDKISRSLKRMEKPLSIGVALFIFYFAAGLIIDAFSILKAPPVKGVAPTGTSGISPGMALLVGAALTGGNIYFLLWWVTVGLPLIRWSQELGVKGFTVMYLSHVWMDYAWLSLLAVLGNAISAFQLGYSVLLIVLGVILVVFGIDMLLKPYGKKILKF